MNDFIINTTITFVKATLQNVESGHDWFHIERVYKNSLEIAKYEQCNLLIVQLGALLHDIADSKFHHGDETIGPKVAAEFLKKLGIDAEVKKQVIDIIENISFKGGNFTTSPKSIELQIIQDADRLDAIGAIGIARAFNYGGYKNRQLYNPSIPPKLDMTKEAYKKSTAPTINHFYEKLLLLKDRMNTQKGKELAQERHHFLEIYLEQFYKEWNSEM